LHELSFRLVSGVKHTVDGQKRSLAEHQRSLHRALDVRLHNEKLKLDMFAQTVELSSPEAILRRGYSITLKNGKAVTSAQELSDGDTLITLFAAGEATSIVTAPK
jgi:exodeoxyribonuclease VII large subunit